jgi:DNA-binding MarR family transcriptional regulator
VENERLKKVIEAMVRIPPIIHRKLDRELFRIALRQCGTEIGPHHLMIMKELQESGTLCTSEIGDVISVARPQMTQSIDKLIGIGMVKREHDTKDRRKINIKLTYKGRNTIERLDNIVKDLLTAKLAVLSDNELDKLAESFDCIAETFLKLQ